MATIKYNEDEEGNKKIILKDGKVSCECCGCESVKKILDTGYFSGWEHSVLKNGKLPPPPTINFSGLNLTLNLLGQTLRLVSSNPAPGFACRTNGVDRIVRTCLRFLCRSVNIEGGVIKSESNTEFGGPTTTGKDLWDDICKPEFGNETQSGTYMYIISFKGWRYFYYSNPEYTYSGPRIIKGDDDYEIFKYKVNRTQ
jgi:hypothetical protein